MPTLPAFSERSLGAVAVPTASMSEITPQDNEQRDSIAVLLTLIFMMCSNTLLFIIAVLHLTLFIANASIFDRMASFALLLSQMYLLCLGLGYYLQSVQTWRSQNVSRAVRLARMQMPPVAIYVATYNEPESVVDETVAAVSLLDYPAKQIYVNCDHPSQQQSDMIERVAKRHHVNFIHRVPNTGYKAGGINAIIQRLGRDLPTAEMFVIFDADSVPMPSFLREIVPYFEVDPRLAFVQAPQEYGNKQASTVANAAGHQQGTFSHYICEGKQKNGALFFCGTNVVFRLDALRDIGGLVTESITEDFATSINLHGRGWRSEFCNVSYVSGMGPTTLRAYWIQQDRWALGNLQSFFSNFRALVFKKGFTLLQRWEYFLTGIYYFTGFNTLICLACPSLYLIFGIRPMVLDPLFYLAVFMPQVVLGNWYFFLAMGKRGFKARLLFMAQCLTTVTYPVYLLAFVAAVMRRKTAFAVTPKGKGDDTLPLKALRWHVATLALLGIAIVIGIYHLFTDRNVIILINVFWCMYYALMIGTVFLFNRPEHEQAPVGSFASTEQVA